MLKTMKLFVVLTFVSLLFTACAIDPFSDKTGPSVSKWVVLVLKNGAMAYHLYSL